MSYKLNGLSPSTLPQVQGVHPLRRLLTVPLLFCSGPKHEACGQYHWRLGWSHCEGTTAPIHNNKVGKGSSVTKTLLHRYLLNTQDKMAGLILTKKEWTPSTETLTWKISSLWDSKEWSFMVRFLRSHMATVLSAEPVARIYSLNGLKARQFTSAE